MAKCPNCNGLGHIHKTGGYGTDPSGDTMNCPVCFGRGSVGGGGGNDGGGGVGLPPLLSLFAFLAAGGIGYYYFENYDIGSGYDTFMHALILGIFVFAGIGVIYRIIMNPIKSATIIVAAFAADYFLLGGAILQFLKGVVPT